MKRFLGCCMTALWAATPLAYADATLVYEMDSGSDGKVEKTLSVSRFFVRVDSSDEEGRYLLFQAGKFFPLFSVNEAEETYTRLTPPVDARLGPESRTKRSQAQPPTDAAKPAAADVSEPTEANDGSTLAADGAAKPSGTDEARSAAEDTVPAEPASEAGGTTAAAASAQGSAEGGPPAPTAVDDSEDRDDDGAVREGSEHDDETAKEPAPPPALAPAPRFQASTKMDEVAGISCRVVQEIVDDKPAVEHCMANKAALGITEREMRTLARLFVLARKRGWDWLGAATEDEEFVSVRSRRLDGDALLELGSVSTDPLPQGYLRISRKFTEIPYAPETSQAAGTEAAAAEQAAPEPEAATPAAEPKKATP